MVKKIKNQKTLNQEILALYRYAGVFIGMHPEG